MIPWKPVWALCSEQRWPEMLQSNSQVDVSLPCLEAGRKQHGTFDNSLDTAIHGPSSDGQPRRMMRPRKWEKNMKNNSHGLFGVANGCQEVEGQALATVVCIGLFSARRRSRDPRFLVLNHGGWRGIRSVPICVNAPLPPIKIS